MKSASLPAVLLLIALPLLAGCHHRPAPAPPTSVPHYVVGAAWQGADNAWFYPREAVTYRATGLAVVEADHPQRLTSDGELFDPHALAASHQTLQLPAIVRVTNLESGLSLLVRINDRGPAEQGRIVALTPRAAELLRIRPGVPAGVRLELDAAGTAALSDQVAGSPHLAVAAAPVGAVQEQSLPAPGAAAGPVVPPISSGDAGLSTADVALAAAALPERATRGIPDPGSLWIDGGQFGRRLYADRVAASIDGTVISEGQGQEMVYRVRKGPYAQVPDADAALDQARRAGVTGARIIVE